jgi:hypothetical protein
VHPSRLQFEPFGCFRAGRAINPASYDRHAFSETWDT